MFRLICTLTFVFCLLFSLSAQAEGIDLAKATVVIRAGDLPSAEKIAPTILSEELARRTGIQWKIASDWPAKANIIIEISTISQPPAWQSQIAGMLASVPAKAEAFSIRVTPASNDRPGIIAITGYDPRGAMFGVGKLLRTLEWKTGSVSIDSDFKATESPDRPIRGHQIGYRDYANSWDAWTYDQFDQHFRELVIFGANCVENIPWQDDAPGRLMKYTREEMNVKFADLCDKYDIDHWLWVPVLIKLPKEEEELTILKRQEEFYRKIKRLDAIFVPGGDPGDNKANVLLPHLERMADVMTRHHSKAKIWLSLQHFKPDDTEFLYQYLNEKQPKWFGGLVMGPGSPPMEPTRQRLAKQYQLRWYPDITHSVRSQYPVPWLDPALGMTLGRECVNPRPVDYTEIYRMDYAFTDGFLTYSDGVHDDFNKSLWSQLGWNPATHPRSIALEYARFFFHANSAEQGADGLFALESDTRGAVANSGSIGATFHLWQGLETNIPEPGSKWRFGMHLMRAYYAYFTRNRLLYETDLERQTLEKLAQAKTLGVTQVLNEARDILARATTHPSNPELITRLNAFGEELFKEIGLQTSVPKYMAANSQRGAILDFLDYPLNNRWWIEDQFDKIAAMPDPGEQLKRIDIVRNWENPGDHGYYDVLGHVGRSPRIAKLLLGGDAMRHEKEIPSPTQRWMGEKRNGLRLAWHQYMDGINFGMVYNDLDTKGNYIVKLFSQRESPLIIDGVKAKLLKTGETYDKVTEQLFEVPAEASKDGSITLTWEQLDEKHLNWRQKHYVTDIWVMKKPAE
jgi:hypothetical protein